jgi:hypothetical protein
MSAASDDEGPGLEEIGPERLRHILELLQGRGITLLYKGGYKVWPVEAVWAALHPEEARAWADEAHRLDNEGRPEPPFPGPPGRRLQWHVLVGPDAFATPGGRDR